jgi:hypothetical protein
MRVAKLCRMLRGQSGRADSPAKMRKRVSGMARKMGIEGEAAMSVEIRRDTRKLERDVFLAPNPRNCELIRPSRISPKQENQELGDTLLAPGPSPESMRANECDEERRPYGKHLDLPVFSRSQGCVSKSAKIRLSSAVRGRTWHFSVNNSALTHLWAS